MANLFSDQLYYTTYIIYKDKIVHKLAFMICDV